MAITTVQEEREIGILVSPEIKFVSLVKSGANRTPFLIVKGEESGGTMKIIQSILAPSDVSIEDIKKTVGDVSDSLTFDQKRSGAKTTSYEQLPVDRLKSDTLVIKTLDAERGIKAIVGEPNQSEDKGIISRMLSKKTSVVEIPEDMSMDDFQTVIKELSYETEDELWALHEATRGILSQAGGDASKKLKALKTCLDSFYDYATKTVLVSKGEALTFKPRDTKEPSEIAVEKSEDAPAEQAPIEAAELTTDVAPLSLKDEVKPLVDEALTPIKDTLTSLAQTIADVQGAVTKMAEMVPSAVTTKACDVESTQESKSDQKDVWASLTICE